MPMNKKILLLSLSFLLSGCAGSVIWGDNGYLTESFPDIRTVPERSKATASRGMHSGDEKVLRLEQLQKLEKEREKIKSHNEAVRQKWETEKKSPPEPEETASDNRGELEKDGASLKARDKVIRDKVFKIQ